MASLVIQVRRRDAIAHACAVVTRDRLRDGGDVEASAGVTASLEALSGSALRRP